MLDETIHFRLGWDSRTSICNTVSYDPDDDDTVCLTIRTTNGDLSEEKSRLITTRETMNVCNDCWEGIEVEQISRWEE